MRRVPDSNYPVRDLFGKGKHGFGPGDKTNGTIATIPGAAFMNAVQEEICNVIEHANLKLEEGAYDQLFMAIKILAKQHGMPSVRNVEALRQYVNADAADVVLMHKYSTQDIGGGLLQLDKSDTTTADNGVTVFVDAVGGRWKRTHTPITLYDAGAIGDGVADDSIAVKRFADLMGYVLVPQGTFKIVGNVFDVPVQFADGGAFYNDAGTRITFRHEITSPDQHIFKGSGEIVFTNSGGVSGEQARQVHISWFGAFPNLGQGDQTARIQRACNAIGNTREGLIDFDIGVYKLSGTVNVPRGVWIRGSGIRRTVFVCDGDGYPAFKTINTAVQFSDIQFESFRENVPLRKSAYIEIWNAHCHVLECCFVNSENALKIEGDAFTGRGLYINVDTQSGSIGSAAVHIKASDCEIDGVQAKFSRSFGPESLIYIGDNVFMQNISIKNISMASPGRMIKIEATHESISNINLQNLIYGTTTAAAPAECILITARNNRYIAGLTFNNININRHPLTGIKFDLADGCQLVDVVMSAINILGASSSGIGIEFVFAAGNTGMIRRVRIGDDVNILRLRQVIVPQDARISAFNNNAPVTV